MTQDSLISFFGWSVVLHLIFLAIAALVFLLAGDRIARLHARLFGLEVDEVARVIYGWLGIYKLLFLVFALVPWIALRLM